MDQSKEYSVAEIAEKINQYIKQKSEERFTMGPIKVETITEPDLANGYSWTVQITMPAGLIPPELMHLYKPVEPPTT